MTDRVRWWLPSTSVFIWLVFFLALTLSPARVKLISADGDPCFHWRLGNWMIEHRKLLRHEVFSHTLDGTPMVEKWWLSDLMFAVIGNRLGWNGIVAAAAILIATTLWLLHRQLIAEGKDALLSTAFVLLAAAACATHWLARPHLFTQLFAVIVVWQLRRFDRGRMPAGQLFAVLPPLMLLWANLHGAFVVGLMLIALWTVGNITNPRKASILAGLGAACLLASLVNPNGWKLHANFYGYLSSQTMVGFVQEMASPDFHKPSAVGFLLLLLALVLVLLLARPRLSATEMLLLGAWTYFALHTVRNVPICALVIVPILAEHTGNALRTTSRWYQITAARVTFLHERSGGSLWVAAALVIVVLWGPRFLNTDIPPEKYPVDAVRFLRQSPKVVRGEMFNDLTWGGYLLLAMPERKVFIDGRVDFPAETLVHEYNEVDEVRPGWQSVFDKYRVGWTLLPSQHALNQLLRLSPGWHVVYADETAMILARETP